ncbi:LysE family transporter [Streptomyces sp. NPDC056910]|uniref:LysE family transporter n=1 Tax=Streptomyces sp. NPDC056910 TaxID=3345964 RepID=UPI0036CE4565
MIAALVAGLLAGYGIAMPVGAVAAYLVALTARTAWKIGACAALGVATADGLYALIAEVGGSALAHTIQPVLVPLRWASALVLVALAARSGVAAARKYRRHHAPSSADEGVPVSAARAYLGLCGITMMNPLTVIYFVALVLGGQAASAPNRLEQAAFVLAAFAASASWQLLLAGGGALLGRALTGARGQLATALASSLLITVLAFRLLASST